MARSPKSGYSSIYDLGCGTGHLTRILADTLSNSEVTGIDSSPEMLAEARCEFPALMWSPSHLGLKELVMQSQWRVKLEPILLAPIPPPETYWRWLSRHASNIDRWETVYLQVLDGKDPVVNFMPGTARRSFLSALPEKESAKFIDAFAKRIVAAYPPQPNGQTLFPSSAAFCSHSVSQWKSFIVLVQLALVIGTLFVACLSVAVSSDALASRIAACSKKPPSAAPFPAKFQPSETLPFRLT